MRIAVFTETFLPKVDGIVNTLCYLLEHLALRGHESLLFAPMGEITQYAETPIIRYHGYAFPLYPELKFVPPNAPIRHPLRAFRPDLVHVVNPVSLGLAGMRLAQRMDVPVVASYHTDIPGYAHRWGMGVLERPLWRFFRWVHDQADLNLCPSSVTLTQLKSHGFQNLKVWTRGVDTERFHPDYYNKTWRYRLTGGNPGAPLLLYVGRLSPEKRVDWLLPVLQAIPGARLAVVGDGPARARLEQQFAGWPAVFTGYLRGTELAQAYTAADIFVFPAANETLGNVVLEAMASGLPVVTARAGGPLDVVTPNETGLMFDSDDQAALVTAVRSLVRDSKLAQRLGDAARAYTERRSWAQVLDRLLDDYRLLIQEHAAARRQPQPRRAEVASLSN